MEFFRICIYFTVFSFAGWISETIICSYNAGHFVKRGFLSGPFLPVYGFGGLIIVILLAPLKESPFWLYIVGVLSVTVLEYVTAVLLENIFHLKLWDYSKKKFNYKGRIWLGSSLFFGVLGLFGVYVINPPLVSLVERLSRRATMVIGISIIVYFLVDTINSVVTVATMSGKLKQIEERLHSYAIEKEKESKIRITELELKVNWFQKRLLDAYPNMQYKKDSRALPYLRAKTQQYQNWKKEEKANAKNKK